MESLKYPIGKFVSPGNISLEDRQKWINSIGSLPERLKNAVNSWDEEKFNTPYRPGGWTVRQLIHHLADSHMNSIIRFKLGLSEENPKIKTYKQDAWANQYDVSGLPASVSLELLDALHQRFTHLLQHMSDDDYQKTIYHPEMNKSISLEKLLALYAWHSEHHLAHILNLKKEKAW